MRVDSSGAGGGGGKRTPGRPLSIFHVMPRGLHFGPERASSIDLCVRDLVSASAHAEETLIFADPVVSFFSGLNVEAYPPNGESSAKARARFIAERARVLRPDVIIVQQHMPTAAEIARRAPGVKVLLHRHNFIKPKPPGGGMVSRLRRGFTRQRYAKLSGLIHVSQASANAFNLSWPDLSLPSCIVYNGLDFSLWRPRARREKEVLFVGRCTPEKGGLEAAQAVVQSLSHRTDWRAKFILSNTLEHPAYLARITETLSELGDRAAIETQRPFSDVKAAYERAAIALCPSICDEAFGRTALEAHAGGCAVISSGTGGLPEVSGPAAILLPEVSSPAIATAIEGLVEDAAARARLAQDGAAWVRARFGIEDVAKTLDRFCQDIAGL